MSLENEVKKNTAAVLALTAAIQDAFGSVSAAAVCDGPGSAPELLQPVEQPVPTIAQPQPVAQPQLQPVAQPQLQPVAQPLQQAVAQPVQATGTDVSDIACNAVLQGVVALLPEGGYNQVLALFPAYGGPTLADIPPQNRPALLAAVQALAPVQAA